MSYSDKTKKVIDALSSPTTTRRRPVAEMTVEQAPYAERDIMALDREGGYYARHVFAMTKYGLHDKSDIAAELAWRDQQIATLRAELDELRADAERYRWLRDDNAYFPEEYAIRGGEELDAAIDAARQEKGHE